MQINDTAYIAGLFDGEGSLQYKKAWERKKKHKGKGYRKTHTWRINMEIAMTDESVIRWVHEVSGVGSVVKRNVKGTTKSGGRYKTQWRWRCSFRDAYHMCKLLWPFAQVKLHKIEQIIDHYEPDTQDLGDNIVDLALERERRNDTIR